VAFHIIALMIGHLDGIDDCQVWGWALDPEHLDIPVSVTILINGRPVADAIALYSRTDVGELMGSTGYHGYFVDLPECYRPTPQAVVEVVASDGSPLGNSPLQAAIPDLTSTHKCAVLFMHIPKTAGTALREAIEPNFRMSEIAYLYPEATLFPACTTLWSLTLEQRSRLRFVIGHFGFGVHKSLPGPCEYVTILRDPVQRAVSQYFHFVRNYPSLVSEGKDLLSLSDAFEKQDNICFDNLMVRLFSGVDEQQCPAGSVDRSMFDLAIHNMRTYFTHVGFQESASQTLERLTEQYGWQKSSMLQRTNLGEWNLTEGQLAVARTTVAHFDKWDICLYEQALQWHGLPKLY